MTTRCELLNSVKNRVKENGIIQKSYSNGDLCCVVGYGLEVLGMLKSEIACLLGAGVINIYDEKRKRDGGLNLIPMDIWNEAHDLLNRSGISRDEWSTLQHKNDNLGQEAVIDVLDKFIATSNC